MRNGVDFDKMKRRLDQKLGASVAKIHDFEPVTAGLTKDAKPTLFKVIATFTGSETKQDMYLAVAKAANNKLSPVEGSFRKIAGSNAHVGYVTANLEIKPYTSDELKHMKVMASNLLMDENDTSLWEVRSGKDSAKFLVRHQEDDLSGAIELSSVKYVNRDFSVPELSRLAVDAIQVNQAVVFVNPRTEEISSGMVVSSTDEFIVVADFNDKKKVTIPTDLVVEVASVDFDTIKENFVEVSAPQVFSESSMEDYYFKVYGYDQNYWEKFKAILESRATI